MKKIILLFQILMLSIVAQQNTKIKRSVTATSNIDAQSDSYKISGTFGQNVVGISSGQQLKISSGYWGWIARWAALETDEELIIPAEFKVKSAYPNPFNPATRIDMEIPDAGLVQITIYDILGRMVLDHKKEYPSAGHYQFVWNPRNASGQPLAAGTYILTIMHQNKIQSQKITFLK